MNLRLSRSSELHYGHEAGKPLGVCPRRRFEVEESLKTSLFRNDAGALDGRAEVKALTLSLVKRMPEIRVLLYKFVKRGTTCRETMSPLLLIS